MTAKKKQQKTARERAEDDFYRDAAKRFYEDEGKIEIDPDARVSHVEAGAYVQAWVWVSKNEV